MTIRVMLVDDSAVARGMITRALESEPGIKVVASAANGKAAIPMARAQQPDVIVLDVEMPEMDGLTALPFLRQESPKTRIVIASAHTTTESDVAAKAMQLGAAACVWKPSASKKDALEVFFRDLRVKVYGVVPGDNNKAASFQKSPVPPSSVTTGGVPLVTLASTSHRVDALAIASSTGGPQALAAVFDGLVGGKLSHIPVFITQHMPPGFTAMLAEQISKISGRPCVEASNGMEASAGRIYLAPGDFHMRASRDGARTILLLDQGPPINFCRPAADPMIASLAEIYGRGLLVLVLTGIGKDGMEGARVAVERGGAVIAQDQASSVVYGMPRAVAEQNLCQAILPLTGIAPYLIERCGGGKK